MIRLSVEVLWSSQALLKRISEYAIRSSEDMYINNYSSVNAETLMELALTCHWVAKKNEIFYLNKQGEKILSTKSFSDRAKLFLFDYVRYVTPTWSRRIPYGRKEAFIFMTKDEQACFYEAGLMEDDPGNHVINWWDQISSFLCKIEDDQKKDIGRKGEYLTVLYEHKRTCHNPYWISLDSNLVGYDVISQRSENDDTRLLIEVKSSEQNLSIAECFISVNEWYTACNAENYLFYLWCFSENKKRLAIIDPQQMFQYIPTNNKSGEWQTVRIPFACFSKSFKKIVMEEGNNG